MLQDLESEDITWWRAYAELEPFGGARDDMRSGVIAATLANVNRRKGSAPFRWDDFFLNVASDRFEEAMARREKEQEATPEQQAERAVEAFQTFNALLAARKELH